MYRDWRHPKSCSRCSHAWGLKHLDRRGCGSNLSRKLSKSERRKHQLLVQTAAMKDVGRRVHSWQKRAYDTMCQVIHRFTLPSSETACRSSSKVSGCCVSSALLEYSAESKRTFGPFPWVRQGWICQTTLDLFVGRLILRL